MALAEDPPQSEAQRRLMWATAGGANTGVPASVAKEFTQSDPGGKLPEKVGKDFSAGNFKMLRWLLNKFFEEEESEREHQEPDVSRETPDGVILDKEENSEGKLSETTREKIGTPGSSKREDMPEWIFLGPDRTYPTAERKNGEWKRTRKLLEAAASRARLNKEPEIERKAEALLAKEFGEDAFVEAQHPRDELGKFTDVMRHAVPELKYFKHSPPRKETRHPSGRMWPAEPHHHFLASTETSKYNVPVTIPGHKSATGIAVKVNPTTKHIHFQELNSHIKGAGRRMVDAVIKAHPDYKFSFVDLSGVSQGEERRGPTFWEKVEKDYPGRFKGHDSQVRETQDEGIRVHAIGHGGKAADALAHDEIGTWPYSIATDKASVRVIDDAGRMHVNDSVLSKAVVSPYLGKEINGVMKDEPGWQTLEDEKTYHLLRDPEALEKSVDTWNGLPLLWRHQGTSADDHPADIVIGATGTNARYEDGNLINDLVIWPKYATKAVEDGEKKSLSCGYGYKAIMAPGTYNGQHFDGRMVQLSGNHVALVDKPRVPGAAVGGDSMPFDAWERIAEAIMAVA